MVAGGESFPGTSRFRVNQRLGAGACGVVYEVFDRSKHSVVALKTLERTEPRMLYRFKREFRELADVVHPNLVTLYEMLSEGDRWFFTMELVHGVDFGTYVHGGRLPPEELVETRTAVTVANRAPSAEETVTRDFTSTAVGTLRPLAADRMPHLRRALAGLATGVQALHELGRLHRDLKPSNVQVRPDDRVVLLDFGLVTATDSVEGPGLLAGTPLYMAPEQAAGQPLTPAADWYAVGVMMFEALSGVLPFGGNPYAAMLAKQRQDAPDVRALVPDVPPDLAELCADLLQRSAAARPTGDEVLRRLSVAHTGATSAPSPAMARSATLPRPSLFVGREAELAALLAALERTREGEASVAWVHGSSGIGKTALVGEFVRRAQALDPATTVIYGRCYPQESVPYKGLDVAVDAIAELLDALPLSEARSYLAGDVGALVRLFPVLGTTEAVAGLADARTDADDGDNRIRAFHAFRETLRQIAARRRLILYLDDCQWGDEDSGALLSELFRLPRPPNLLLVGTYRTEDAATSPLLGRLTSQLALAPTDMELAPLAEPESVALASTLLRDEDGPIADVVNKLVADSSGNPYFLTELAHQRMADAGQPSSDAPDSVDALITARVAALSDSERRILELVSVAGRPLAVTVAMDAASLGQPEPDTAVPATLATLRARLLLRVRASRSIELIEPYHDRIRAAVLPNISAEHRAAYHRATARVLEQRGDSDPEHLAEHWFAAGDEQRAGAYAVEAASRADAALAFERASQLYAAALDTVSDGSEQWLDIAARHADALANAGRSMDAARAYLVASGRAAGELANELRRLAAHQFFAAGELDLGLDAARPLFDEVDLPPPMSDARALRSVAWSILRLRGRGLEYTPRRVEDVAPALIKKIDLCWTMARGLSPLAPLDGLAYLGVGARLALRSGEQSRIALNLSLWAGMIASVQIGDLERVLAITEGAARASGDRYAEHFVLCIRGMGDYFRGDFANSVRHCEAAEERLRECQGVAFEYQSVQQIGLFAHGLLGHWNLVRERAAAYGRDAIQRGNVHSGQTFELALAWVAALSSGDMDALSARLDAYIDRWGRDNWVYQYFYEAHTRLVIALYSDDALAHVADIERCWRGLRSARQFRVHVIDVLLHARRAALYVNAAYQNPSRRTALLRRASRDAKRIARIPFPLARPLSARLGGCIALARDDRDEAILALIEAGHQFASLGHELEHAKTRLLIGRILGGDEGEAIQRSALDALESEGIANPLRVANAFAPGILYIDGAARPLS